jgi:hypothetical protein
MPEDKKEDGWLLRNKKNEVLLESDSIVDVVKEGRKYPLDEVYIVRKLAPGTCFF